MEFILYGNSPWRNGHENYIYPKEKCEKTLILQNVTQTILILHGKKNIPESIISRFWN